MKGKYCVTNNEAHQKLITSVFNSISVATFTNFSPKVDAKLLSAAAFLEFHQKE